MHVNLPAHRFVARLFVVLLFVGLSIPTSVHALPTSPHPPVARPNTAAADEPLGDAFLINPLGPLIGLAATAFEIPSLLINLRVHHTLTKRIGLTVITNYGHTRFLFRYQTVGVRAGPRFSISSPGLSGWYVFPNALLGWGWTRNFHGKVLASGLVAGGGLEAGYTMNWRAFVLELGAGLYTSRFYGGTGGDEGGLKPSLNTSIGYGW